MSRCEALTTQNSRCQLPAVIAGYCINHYWKARSGKDCQNDYNVKVSDE